MRRLNALVVVALGAALLAGCFQTKSAEPPPPAPTCPSCVTHLNRYEHFTHLMTDAAVKMSVQRLKSAVDGIVLSETILESVKTPRELVIFLHGMDGDAGDVVVAEQLVRARPVRLVGLAGRGPSWVSQAFFQDLNARVRSHLKGFSGFYLMGISMGGTQALAAASQLPPDLKAKLRGVMAFIPGGDLELTARESSHPRVKETLLASVGGDWQKLKEVSPHQRVTELPKALPHLIVYNEADTIVPVQGLLPYLKQLKEHKHPLVVYREPGEHSYVYKDLDLAALFDQLQKKRTEEFTAALPRVPSGP